MTTTASLLLAASLFAGPCGCDEAPVELWPRCGGAPEPYDPRPGDVILFRHRDVAQNVLYALAFAGGVTHCGIVVAHPDDGRPVILEAPGRRYPVLLSEVAERAHTFEGKVWVRRRALPLTDRQSAALTAYAAAQLGKGFDTLGLIGPPLGHPTRRRPGRCLSEKDLDAPRWFCSKLTICAAVAAGLLDGCVVRPSHTDPSNMLRDRRLDLTPGWEKPLVVVGKERRRPRH